MKSLQAAQIAFLLCLAVLMQACTNAADFPENLYLYTHKELTDIVYVATRDPEFSEVRRSADGEHLYFHTPSGTWLLSGGDDTLKQISKGLHVYLDSKVEGALSFDGNELRWGDARLPRPYTIEKIVSGDTFVERGDYAIDWASTICAIEIEPKKTILVEPSEPDLILITLPGKVSKIFRTLDTVYAFGDTNPDGVKMWTLDVSGDRTMVREERFVAMPGRAEAGVRILDMDAAAGLVLLTGQYDSLEDIFSYSLLYDIETGESRKFGLNYYGFFLEDDILGKYWQ